MVASTVDEVTIYETFKDNEAWGAVSTRMLYFFTLESLEIVCPTGSRTIFNNIEVTSDQVTRPNRDSVRRVETAMPTALQTPGEGPSRKCSHSFARQTDKEREWSGERSRSLCFQTAFFLTLFRGSPLSFASYPWKRLMTQVSCVYRLCLVFLACNWLPNGKSPQVQVEAEAERERGQKLPYYLNLFFSCTLVYQHVYHCAWWLERHLKHTRCSLSSFSSSSFNCA